MKKTIVWDETALASVIRGISDTSSVYLHKWCRDVFVYVVHNECASDAQLKASPV